MFQSLYKVETMLHMLATMEQLKEWGSLVTKDLQDITKK